MNPEETHVNIASDPMYLTLVFSINLRKIKFIAYSHIPFNQNLDKKNTYSYVRAKFEAVKQLRAVFC